MHPHLLVNENCCKLAATTKPIQDVSIGDGEVAPPDNTHSCLEGNSQVSAHTTAHISPITPAIVQWQDGVIVDGA